MCYSGIDVVGTQSAALARSKYLLVIGIEFPQVVERRGPPNHGLERRLGYGAIPKRCLNVPQRCGSNRQNMLGIALWAEPPASPAAVSKQFHLLGLGNQVNHRPHPRGQALR